MSERTRCTRCHKRKSAKSRWRLCWRCRRDSRDQQRSRMKVGKCTGCGEQAIRGQCRCATCAALVSKSTTRWRMEHEQQGICLACLEPAVRSGFCRKHYEACCERRHERYTFRKQHGICIQCLKPAVCGVLCEEHALKSRAEYRARYARRKAAGLCVRCGVPVEGTGTLCPVHRKSKTPSVH